MSNESLIGKHVLIGITYLDHGGHMLEQTQVVAHLSRMARSRL